MDKVYIPTNCDREFHWVLTVVALKESLIRVYDSMSISRHRDSLPEIHKLTMILLAYLVIVAFWNKIHILIEKILKHTRINRANAHTS